MIGIDDVKRGDILLVTQHPTSPLAQLIVDLDRSPQKFTHSGIAGGDGTIISSYPSSLEGLLPVDVGGLHHDHFSHFWKLGQSIHRLDLPDEITDADRDAALQRLEDYPEKRETRFGVASIVIVAAALHALIHEEQIGSPRVADIIRTAVKAGQEWASPDEFFCAEFSAVIYDLTSLPKPFTVADLRPGGPARMLEQAEPQPLIEIGLEGLLLGRDDEDQKKALTDFVATVQAHDPAFFDEGLKVVWDEILVGLGLRRGGPVPEDMSLPAAMITPRMLAAWGKETQEIRQE
ncbi:hypothetical protein [Actinomycetospora soli]|uniref:hypothetical protein n=1 Tax=Actinomycetospora soli TaxID=2893887 RepID=UPI001E556BEA|nr:hypothetical protein [Actinomycetospora soli]MCD2187875.1 hypothetical protein [Actinomycetospora soli]